MLLHKPASVCVPGAVQVSTRSGEQDFCLGYRTQAPFSVNKQSFEEGERTGESAAWMIQLG